MATGDIVNFVSFGNKSRYPRSLARIKNEACDVGLFTDFFVWSEDDLDADFVRVHDTFIMNNPRGYGYWIWKPQVILQALRRTPPGGYVLYADAGCSFNPSMSSHNRILDYVKMAKSSPKGVFGFHLGEHLDRRWNKMDTVCNVLGVESVEQIQRIINTPQCLASVSVWHNIPEAVAFVEEWLSICVRDGYRYVDDSPSLIPNMPDFNEHRHDQAIFSLLMKKYNAPVIPDETWHPNWHLCNWPIHVSRIRE
jgi:hypothetical protein